MTLAELKKHQQDSAVLDASCKAQIDGTFKMFESASIMGNKLSMDTFRTQLHELIDMRLDSIHNITEFSKRIMRFEE